MVDTAHPTPNANQDLQDFADALNMEDEQDEVIGTTHYSLLITHYSLLITHLPSLKMKITPQVIFPHQGITIHFFGTA
jgi:hypothetical protein